VRMFEVMTPEDLRQSGFAAPAGPAATPAAVTPAPAPATTAAPEPTPGGAVSTPVR
jgi:hypothetical protein